MKNKRIINKQYNKFLQKMVRKYEKKQCATEVISIKSTDEFVTIPSFNKKITVMFND